MSDAHSPQPPLWPLQSAESRPDAGAEDIESSAPGQVPNESTTCGDAVPALSLSEGPAEGPTEELPAVDPALFEQAKSAVRALRTAGRAPSGRFGPGNGGNLKHGLRSTRLLTLPDVQVWHAETVAAISHDLGGDAHLSTLQRACVREAGRLEVLAAALGDDLLERGCLSAKGKTRAALTTYLSLIDRFQRMATTLGLARRPKRVEDVTDYLTQYQQTGEPHEHDRRDRDQRDPDRDRDEPA